MVDKTSEAQKEFDEKYISASEIVGRLDITYAHISNAMRDNRLPDAIMVGNKKGARIWERDVIEPYLVDWNNHLVAIRKVRQLRKSNA